MDHRAYREIVQKNPADTDSLIERLEWELFSARRCLANIYRAGPQAATGGVSPEVMAVREPMSRFYEREIGDIRTALAALYHKPTAVLIGMDWGRTDHG